MLRATPIILLALAVTACGGVDTEDDDTDNGDEPEVSTTCSGQELDRGWRFYEFAFQNPATRCMFQSTQTYAANSLSEARQCAEDQYPNQTPAYSANVCTVAYGLTIPGRTVDQCTARVFLNIQAGGQSPFENQKDCDRAQIANCARGECSWNDVTSDYVLRTVPGGCRAVEVNQSALDRACP